MTENARPWGLELKVPAPSHFFSGRCCMWEGARCCEGFAVWERLHLGRCSPIRHGTDLLVHDDMTAFAAFRAFGSHRELRACS